jgi:hypothetical protein
MEGPVGLAMVGQEPMYFFFEAYEAGEPIATIDFHRQLVTDQQRLALVLAMVTSRLVIKLREITGACFDKLRFYVADVGTGVCVEIKGLPHKRWWNPTMWYASGWALTDYRSKHEDYNRHWFLSNLSGYASLMGDLIKLQGPQSFSLVTVAWLDDYLSWVSEFTGWAKEAVSRKVAKLVYNSGTATGDGKYPFRFPSRL